MQFQVVIEYVTQDTHVETMTAQELSEWDIAAEASNPRVTSISIAAL